MRDYPAADATAQERLCDRLLEASKQGLALDAVVEPEVNGKRPSTSSPCWPEICQAVVAFQRGQGVNMNLVGPCSRVRATSACCPRTGRRAVRRCAALPCMPEGKNRIWPVSRPWEAAAAAASRVRGALVEEGFPPIAAMHSPAGHLGGIHFSRLRSAKQLPGLSLR